MSNYMYVAVRPWWWWLPLPLLTCRQPSSRQASSLGRTAPPTSTWCHVTKLMQIYFPKIINMVKVALSSCAVINAKFCQWQHVAILAYVSWNEMWILTNVPWYLLSQWGTWWACRCQGPTHQSEGDHTPVLCRNFHQPPIRQRHTANVDHNYGYRTSSKNSAWK